MEANTSTSEPNQVVDNDLLMSHHLRRLTEADSMGSTDMVDRDEGKTRIFQAIDQSMDDGVVQMDAKAATPVQRHIFHIHKHKVFLNHC